MAEGKDVRVRLQVGDYRCVAPDARFSNGKVYLNGRLVIEKRAKDSLGADMWVSVGFIESPQHAISFKSSPDPDTELKRALYTLLGMDMIVA